MKQGREIMNRYGILLLGAALGAAGAAGILSSRLQEAKETMPRHAYQLDRAVAVAGRQGIATDGSYYWVSGSTTLTKYDRNWNVVAENKDPLAGFDVEVNHLGDIDVYQNEIYAGAEYFMDGVGKNIQMAVYDGDTLQLKRTYLFEQSSGQLECSGIAVNPDDRTIAMCSWVGEESGRYVYLYDLDSGAYLRKVHLQCPPQWLQGIAYYDGDYYLSADDGTADEQEPDHIYRTRITSQSTASVVLERTLDDVEMQGEIEGLTFDPVTKQMLVLYNHGSRIVLGMVKGFYPGYDHEISEVYLYRRKQAGI